MVPAPHDVAEECRRWERAAAALEWVGLGAVVERPAARVAEMEVQLAIRPLEATCALIWDSAQG